NFPLADVYPKGMRETRDLLRRRLDLVHKRAELSTHREILNAQNNRPPFGTKLSSAANRAEVHIPERFGDPSVRMRVRADLARIDQLDEPIARGGALPDAPRPGRRRPDLSPAADDFRRRAAPGPGALGREARRRPLRAGRSVPVVRAAGALRARIGRPEAGLGRQEDRQRAPALGLRGDRRPGSPHQRTGPAVEAEAGEAARLRPGAGHPGGPAGAERLPHDRQAGSLRRGALMDRPGAGGAAGRAPPAAGQAQEEGELREGRGATASPALVPWRKERAPCPPPARAVPAVPGSLTAERRQSGTSAPK